jgi:hypothetical protein
MSLKAHSTVGIHCWEAAPGHIRRWRCSKCLAVVNEYEKPSSFREVFIHPAVFDGTHYWQWAGCDRYAVLMVLTS